jgi:hypothetical protein
MNFISGYQMSLRKFAVGSVFAGVLAIAQAPVERPFRNMQLDPALNEIIAPDAKLETLGDHFGLTEGPVWVQQRNEGYLLFSDNTGNEIYKWSPRQPLSVFLQKSGYTGNNLMNARAQTVTGGADAGCTRPAHHHSNDRPHDCASGEGRHTNAARRSLRGEAIQRAQRYRE